MSEPARRRLSPENRRNQLLDCARDIVVNKGLSSLTMELLATTAGVSNPLIYKYFDTRKQILEELLVRELKAFRRSMREQLRGLKDYREIVRVYVDTNFQQFDKGNIVSILLSQPDIREAVAKETRSSSGLLFVKELASEYQVPRSLAERIIVLASGASIAAAEHQSRYGGDRELLIDQTVEFIFAGIERLTS